MYGPQRPLCFQIRTSLLKDQICKTKPRPHAASHNCLLPVPRKGEPLAPALSCPAGEREATVSHGVVAFSVALLSPASHITPF